MSSCGPTSKLACGALLALTACSQNEAVVENSPARIDVELSAWPSTTLSLTEVGAPPLAVVRVSADGDGAEEIGWETRFETTATRGAVTSDPMRVVQRRTFRVATSGDAPATFDFEVTAASDEAEGGAPVDPTVARSLRGLQGRWRADDRCGVVDAGIVTVDGPARRHLPGLLRAAVELCPLLPEEPVGVGARWTTAQVRPDGATEETAWVLTQRFDDRVVLTFTSHSERDGTRTMAEGRVEVDSGRTVPVRYDARGQTASVMPEVNASGSTTPVTWTTTWTMHAEAAPLQR